MERLVLLDRAPTIGLESLPEKMLRVVPTPGVPSETTFEGAVTALKQRLIVMRSKRRVETRWRRLSGWGLAARIFTG